MKKGKIQAQDETKDIKATGEDGQQTEATNFQTIEESIVAFQKEHANSNTDISFFSKFYSDLVDYFEDTFIYDFVWNRFFNRSNDDDPVVNAPHAVSKLVLTYFYIRRFMFECV